MKIVQLLSTFDRATVERSRGYISEIDAEQISVCAQPSNTWLIDAQVRGRQSYRTRVTVDGNQQQVLQARCSCFVGDHCKHAAALVQYAVQHQLIARSPAQENRSAWSERFESTLHHFQVSTETPTFLDENHFIYIVERQQTGLNTLQLYKVRRNKQGELREAKQYTNYANILNSHVDAIVQERVLFQQIYSALNIEKDHLLPPHSLSLKGLPASLLQQAAQYGWLYANDYKNPTLQWSDAVYRLDFTWETQADGQSELLIADIYALGSKYELKHAQHIRILNTQPVTYVDTKQKTIGQVDAEYRYEIINDLLKMPSIPSHLLEEMEQTLQRYRVDQNVTLASSDQKLKKISGQPKAVLRFGDHIQIDRMFSKNELACASVFFDYPAGRVAANTPEDSFVGQQQQKPVRQMRDLEQEQALLEKFWQCLPDTAWFEQLPHIQFPHIDTQNLVCIDAHELIAALLPINLIEKLGWTVEHSAQSLFNLQLAQHVDVALSQADERYEWFNIGMTIQDQRGNKHNLAELLARLIQLHPKLLDMQRLHEFDEEHYFVVPISNAPSLLIYFKDIKPILVHLNQLFNQDDDIQLDVYDVALLSQASDLNLNLYHADRLKQFIQRLQQGEQQALATPEGFCGELRSYQQQGLGWLQFLTETRHGGILADDMGLGKTAQTLAHILLQQQAGQLNRTPVLIICPTSLTSNWFKEAQKFAPQLKVLVLHGHNRHVHFQRLAEYDVVISTYPLLARDIHLLKDQKFHMAVLDEAHYIKNPNAKVSQAARQLQAQHRLCLTGTPLENHLGELWSLFHFLMPGFLGTQDHFNRKYRYPIERQQRIDLQEKLVLRTRPFILRRLKNEVAKELPKKTTIEVNIDMNDAQLKLYEALRTAMQSNVRRILAERGLKRSHIQILDALLKLRQVCCHPRLLNLEGMNSHKIHSAKLDYLMDTLPDMLQEGRKILIFSQFTSMLSLIGEALQKQGIEYVKLTGQTQKRDDVIQRFQSGEVPIFLISLKAGGVGLNLTAADTVIHYDPWWNPAAEDQASDRAWRIGQDKPVFVYKLLMNQSIEEKILLMQKNKAQLAQSILSKNSQINTSFSEDELLQLFDAT